MKLHGCHNRPDFKENLTVQDGWTWLGSGEQRRMRIIPFRMERRCVYDLKKTDQGCTGCRWQGVDE